MPKPGMLRFLLGYLCGTLTLGRLVNSEYVFLQKYFEQELLLPTYQTFTVSEDVTKNILRWSIENYYTWVLCA